MRSLVALVLVAVLAACRAAEVVPAAAALEGALVGLMGTVPMPQGQPGVAGRVRACAFCKRLTIVLSAFLCFAHRPAPLPDCPLAFPHTQT